MKRIDRTPLSCLAVVALAAVLNAGKLIPSPAEPQPGLDSWGHWFWQFTCDMTWNLPPWCPTPPKITPPDPTQCGDPGFIGPCQP
jgi:hypothetical protein